MSSDASLPSPEQFETLSTVADDKDTERSGIVESDEYFFSDDDETLSESHTLASSQTTAIGGDEKAAILSLSCTSSDEDGAQHCESKQLTSILPTIALVIIWLCLSCSLVLCNKYIIGNLHFSFPATLTCWHLTSATIITQLLAHTTNLLKSRRTVNFDTRDFLLTVAPIGFLFSVSLVCNNMPYLSLSVAFIQMLKGLGPAFVLLASWSLGLESPNLARCANIGVIILGVTIASFGELKFAISGFLYQVTGLLFDGYRLGLTRKLLSGERKMQPLVALYFLAPVSAIMLAAAAWGLEWRGDTGMSWEHVQNVGWAIFLLNAGLSFALNLVIVQLIGKTGPLTIPLCGELKTILIVLASMTFWNTIITPLQVFGYCITSLGLVCYSVGGLLREKFEDIRRQRWGYTPLRRSSDVEMHLKDLTTEPARRQV